MELSKTDVQSLTALIDKAENIVITGHKSPDGDSMGSSLGLYHYLKSKHKKVHVVFPDLFASYLGWMPGSDDILSYQEDPSKCEALFSSMDLFFALDYNVLSRVGEAMHKALHGMTCKKIMIDHHLHPDFLADVLISFPKASSTAALIYDCIEAMGDVDQIDQNIANCLYTGIMTDTGSFKFPSTSARTHQQISVLLEKGAQSSYIHQQVFDQNSYDRLKLLGYMLSEKMEILPQYNTVLIGLTAKELKDFNFKKGDTEGFVNYGLSIKGVKLVAFCSEKNNQIRISFRSKDNVPANLIASDHFNGGGHQNAAGGLGETSIEHTLKKIREILPDYATYLV